jgi:YD repeat-containing protein
MSGVHSGFHRAVATPGEATVSHTYTPTGQYATTTDASGSTAYTYDNMDRITSKATPEGTLNYSYDAAGHVAGISSWNANGASMSYTYDRLDRLSTVVDNRLNGATTTYSYDGSAQESVKRRDFRGFLHECRSRLFSSRCAPTTGHGYWVGRGTRFTGMRLMSLARG